MNKKINTINTLNNAKKCNNFFATTSFNDDNQIKIPIDFANLIDKNDKNDPLLKQVFINNHNNFNGFTGEPLKDSDNSPVDGLIHKYKNRALLITTGSCAIFCRYCFRQNFPYIQNDGIQNWDKISAYLTNNTQINELILSGGDPLSLSDKKLCDLFEKIEKISNIKTIRIHSRTFSIVAGRITKQFIKLINDSNLKIIIVSHINHPNEITSVFTADIKNLNCQILNQSVLLRGVNDNTKTLINLSNKLWEIGILPYYLHLLDKVSGTEDYLVDDKKAKKIHLSMQENLSGYLVPKLVRDNGEKYKTNIS